MMVSEWFAQSSLALELNLPRFALIFLLIFFLGAFEYFWPAERGQRFVGRLRNVVYIGLLFVLGLAFISLLSIWIHPDVPSWDISGASMILLVLGVLFLSDFLFYWYHRALHSIDWLWPIHELHHADTELNATSSLRTYWFELPIQAVFIALPTQFILGPSLELRLMIMVITTSILFFTHANLRLHLGPLTRVVTGPQVHRVHHGIEKRYQDKNFAQFFPMIDLIFGTYYHPSKDEFPKTGTNDLPVDASIPSVLVRPFKSWFNR